MNDTTLDQRVQDAARDALQLVARNPAADRDVAARLVANAVLAELHRQPVTVPPWAAIATASAPWGTCQDCGAAAGPDCDCPPQDEQQEQPVHACPPGCPGCNAPGGIGECGPEDQPAPAPRNALSGPQTAEPPAPGPERHPGGENGPHTGTQRAEAPPSTLPCACCCTNPAHVGRPDHCDPDLHRAFREAITRQWPGVAEHVMDDVLHDVVARHLDLVARATATLSAELTRRAPLTGQYAAALARVHALAERWQYTGDRKGGPLPELRAALAAQAGDDTTGGTAVLTVTVTAPTQENAGQWAATLRDLIAAEHGDEMRLDMTISPAPADQPKEQ